jgi:hypothetical protein
MADISFKDWIESPGYGRAKEIISHEINDPKVYRKDPIDYSVFKQSKKEKEKLATMKLQNKLERIAYYGKDANKYLNIPSRQLTGTLRFTF